MNLLELYGVCGFGSSGMVRNQRGEALGYANLRGSQCFYYDSQGRTVGYAEHIGSELILRKPGGTTVQSFRSQ